MRCKSHYTDLSSIVGVCASCLRERLSSLALAHQHTQPQPQTLEHKIRRKSGNSDSPIHNQHNSDISRHRTAPDPQFFTTPEVAPTAGSHNQCRKKKPTFLRFNLLSKLFRSKKRTSNSNPDLDPDPRVSVSVSVSDYKSCGGDDSATSATQSPFRFSKIRSGTGVSRVAPRQQYCSDRGMSPVRLSDCGGGEDEFCYGSVGYETCESRKQTPRRTPARSSVRRGGRGGGGYVNNVSGLGFCLSPLVRVRPCRRWNQRGVAPVDGYVYNNKLFCANGSRKVADFGRMVTSR